MILKRTLKKWYELGKADAQAGKRRSTTKPESVDPTIYFAMYDYGYNAHAPKAAT